MIIMGVLAGTLVVYLFACIFFRKRKIREKETSHSTAKRDVSAASQQLDFTNAAGSGGKDGGMVVLGGAAVDAAAVVASTYGAGDDAITVVEGVVVVVVEGVVELHKKTLI